MLFSWTGIPNNIYAESCVELEFRDSVNVGKVIEPTHNTKILKNPPVEVPSSSEYFDRFTTGLSPPLGTNFSVLNLWRHSAAPSIKHSALIFGAVALRILCPFFIARDLFATAVDSLHLFREDLSRSVVQVKQFYIRLVALSPNHSVKSGVTRPTPRLEGITHQIPTKNELSSPLLLPLDIRIELNAASNLVIQPSSL